MDWMHSLTTVTAFLTFIGIVLWACSKGRKESFERAAHSVLQDDVPQNVSANPGSRHE